MTGSYIKISQNLPRHFKPKSLQHVFPKHSENPTTWNTLESNVPRESVNFSCLVFPLMNFDELVDYVNYWKKKEIDVSAHKFIFLIDKNYKLWFAPEGIADNDLIPAHYQMTGAIRKKATCFAAGNIFFSKTEPNKLIKISNKSGDFKPEPHSLGLLLAIFACESFGDRAFKKE